VRWNRELGVRLPFEVDGVRSSIFVIPFFKTRPIVRELAKDGLDVCWYDGWQKRQAVESLRQFNAIWLLTEHEDECPYPAKETAAALKAYVEQGGGLVVALSGGRYAEAPVDAYWKEILSVFGAEILHEEVSDMENLASFGKRELFYTDNFENHPVTAGVAGLWLPLRTARQGSGTYTWGSLAVRYTADWQIVASTAATGKSYRKNEKTNVIDWNAVGTYAKGPVPIVAVRQFGKGRVVVLAVHKDNCGWMYGIDKWPNVMDRGELKGRRSDMVRLLSNSLHWASQASVKDAKFLSDYEPVEWKTPPYRRVQDFGEREYEKKLYTERSVIPYKSGSKGVIGLHSSLSDGVSSVAEYAAEAKKLGLGFIVFADPLTALTKERLAKLRSDCAAVSDTTFHAFPGVEFVDMNGTGWFIFHDKVEWPMAEYTIDGRTYRVFDGTNVLQRGKYSGQNLYRGGILTTKNLKKKGVIPVNMPMYNLAMPRVYDEGKLVEDNEAAMLQAPVDVTMLAPVSFTRIRAAKELARAVETSATFVDSNEQLVEAMTKPGQYMVGGLNKAHVWVQCGREIFIRDFAVERLSGTDLFQCVFSVESEVGIVEAKVVDGAKRVLARFDGKGERIFSRHFVFPFDTQSYAQLIVTDAKGNRAYSAQYWVNHYHAGLNRCGDNNNLLSCNPELYCYMEWDDIMIEPMKAFSLPPTHFHFSESRGWNYEDATRMPCAEMDWKRSRLSLKGIDYPSEEKNMMPSSKCVFTLVQPNVVTIVDQYQGDAVMTPTRSATRGVFGRCSDPIKVSEGRYWKRHQRVYQFCDRTDKFWRLTQDQVSPEYRGGYAMVEGVIEFTEDVELSAGVTLVSEKVTNPNGTIEKYGSAGPLSKGEFYAAISTPEMWYAFFGLGDSDPIVVHEMPIANGLRVSLVVGAAKKYAKGDRIRYRYATGSFIEPPHNGEYLRWFAGMLDGSRFHHEIKRGRLLGIEGIVDLAAQDGVAEATLGPTWFIQRYPVRISGLVDNGSAFWTDGGKIVKPLAFANDRAYAEVALEEGKTWKFMNAFLSEDANLRFCYVPAMPGHSKDRVQILNNTSHPITSKVRDLIRGGEFMVTVPAGDKIDHVL